MAAPKLDTQLLIKKIDELPSLPAIVYELNKVISNPMSSTKEVEAVMAKDIGMTAKVLKLANSAYYAIPGGVSSLGRAVAFIGFDTIQQLVLSSSIIKALDVKGTPDFNINEFWKHSVAVAIATETIGQYLNHPTPFELFTCGLIHDMGKIALYLGASENLLYICDETEKQNKTFYDFELELKQTPHTELGKILGEKWQLPKSIQAVARYHHENDITKRGNLSKEMHQTVDIAMLANLLTHALKFGYSGHNKIMGAPNELLQRLMINPQKDLPPILKNIKANLEKSSEFIATITSQK